MNPPYQYDPFRVAYSLTLGWVPIPHLPVGSDVNEFIECEMEGWIVRRRNDGDIQRLAMC